jgi:tetratricopeptide (TPR) repeat protein
MKRELIVAALCVSCAHSPAPTVNATASATAAEHAGHHAPSISLQSLSKDAALLPGLGNHQRAASQNPSAQAYFDQGLRLTYGFNHDEAARSFAKAAELDPSCGICFWGASLTLGPNYNVPMLPDRARAAWDALQKARQLAPSATPAHQALIGALEKRYGGPDSLDPPAMQPFTEAYAKAMRGVAQRFPDDNDIQVLFAESMMNIHPWKLWAPDGQAAPGTQELVDTLERVLARAPEHPGANHYYIHAVEASTRPEEAIPSADRLGKLMPGAGHLVHMPAHIYQRVGRYNDASNSNELAAKVDLAYVDQAKPWGYYPVYLAHNQGFLSYSASMEGRRAVSLAAARDTVKNFPKEIVCSMPGMDFFNAVLYFAQVRFGRWDEILAESRPDPKYAILTGVWMHARGMALASTGKLDEARGVLYELEALSEAVPKDLTANLSQAYQLLTLAAQVVRARIAEKSGDAQAIALWTDAVAQADILPYSEPADWFYPVRHYLGAALLSAKKYREAEEVYREDLRRNPKNGWALYGLAQSLKLQKRTADATKVQQELKAAWKHADFQLTSSAF